MTRYVDEVDIIPLEGRGVCFGLVKIYISEPEWKNVSDDFRELRMKSRTMMLDKRETSCSREDS